MKKVISIISAIVIVIGINVPVSAKINGILVKNNKEQKMYEYNYDDLRDSYYDHLTGGQGPLFKDYSNHINNILAFSDSEKGYIDYGLIRDEYYEHITKGQTFDVQKFVDASNDSMKYHNNLDVEVRKVNNGSVVTGEIKNLDAFDVLRIY